MEDRDKISLLQELATTHFNEGNLSAAVNAWEQVLELDPGNGDAQRGLELAKRKLEGDQPAPAAAAEMDADATMVFNPNDVGGVSAGGAGAGGEDPDQTMMFDPNAAHCAMWISFCVGA